MTFFILSGAVFLLAAFVQGMIGFGGALIAIPLLCLYLDIQVAVPLCILNGLLMTSYMSYTLRRELDWAKISPLLFGALPGIVVGVLVLKQVDPQILKLVLGLLLMSYSLYKLVVDLPPMKVPKIFGYLAGFFTGAFTAALSAGGPPAIIYATLTDWSKDEIKATLTGFFVINSFLTAIVQTYNGLLTSQVLELFAVTVVFVLLGTYVGLRVSDKINREGYLRVVLVFLLFMGGMMVWG